MTLTKGKNELTTALQTNKQTSGKGWTMAYYILNDIVGHGWTQPKIVYRHSKTDSSAPPGQPQWVYNMKNP